MTTDRESYSAGENPTEPTANSEKTSIHTPSGDSGARLETKPYGPRPATPNTSPPERLPIAFGRYRVESVYRSGGFGTVYLAHDPQLDRKVAVKVPRRDLRPEDAAAFIQEARRVAQLRHPGIVMVHDVGIEGGRGYIISDFVHGTPLNEWLKEARPLWRQAVRITIAVADALAHAHAHITVHRDVKPSNIILTDDLSPVLIDFGLALTEQEQARPAGGSVGTPAYMSPEQAAGRGHRLDGRTDIYSLGVVFYEMLCGRRPHRAPDVDELLRQVCEDEPQPPRQLVQNIPREAERICLKAMAKRLSDRYTTASDLVEELRDLLKAYPEPPAPKTGDRSEEEAAEVRRPPAGAGAVASPLPKACPRCAWLNAVEAQFCGGCGVALSRNAAADLRAAPATLQLSPSPAVGAAPVATESKEMAAERTPRSAERRQVTALFCSFDLAAEVSPPALDLEDHQELLLAAAQVCKEVIGRFRGTVIGSASEGLFASFGFPVALEDAARRAVLAGLAIQEALRDFPKQAKHHKTAPLSARVAIHTGFALVGEWRGHESGDTLTVVGEARNVAVRLEGIAEPGMVLISTATQRLVQGFFVCAALGTHTLTGTSRPLEVFRVLRASKVSHPIEAAAVAGLTPLIGRDQEVGLLRGRWEQVREGMGQVVLLVGEAGIGKSRLVHVLKEHVRHEAGGRGDAVVEWRCSPNSQNTALYPAADFFASFLGFQREDDPRARLDELVKHLGSLNLDDPDIIPLFATVLLLPLDERYPPLNLSPQGQKERTLEALGSWLLRYTRRQPVLFIVEDLHWVDASTLEFLTRLMAQTETERLLMLFTFRPEFVPPWTSRTPQMQVVLNRLTRRQIADLMQQKIGVSELPAALVEQIAARTDGVPLFVEEFTRMVVESGYLHLAEGKVELADALPLHAIPATLQDLLTARLERMASVRDVVQVAAVLGRTFSYELLRAVALLDEPTLQHELSKLVEAEILFQKGRPPRCSYLFKHALIQDAAYQSLLKSRRQQLHRRVAEVLEKLFPEVVQAQPELAAHHCTEAGLVHEALMYWEKAALHAQDRSANTEGIGHLGRALGLLAALEESPERSHQELRSQVLLAVMLQAVRGYAAPEVSAVHARARQLSAKIADPILRFHVLWGIWSWRFIRDELDLGLELVEEMQRLAETQGDPGIVMETCFASGCNRFYRGDFARTRSDCEQGFSLYTPERGRLHARHTGQNAGVTNQCYSGVALWFLGYPQQAEARVEQALTLARELNHPFSLAFALYHHALLRQLLRRGHEAQADGEAVEALSSEQGFPFWKALGVLCRGAGWLLQGHYAEGVALLREGLTSYRVTGAGVTVSHYHALLGAALGGAGKITEALAAVADGLAVARRLNERFVESELHRVQAELLLRKADADPVAVEACLRRALDMAREQQARSLELRAAMSLYRWRPTAEARQILAQTYTWFREGLETADLQDARLLLGDLKRTEEE
jgi:class 3 adenylate cyclase/predicted ATPase